MDMECGRNVTDDPFVPKIVVENLHGLRDVVDMAIGDRRVERIPLLLRQRSLRRAVAPDDQLPGRTSRKYGSFVVCLLYTSRRISSFCSLVSFIS